MTDGGDESRSGFISRCCTSPSPVICASHLSSSPMRMRHFALRVELCHAKVVVSAEKQRAEGYRYGRRRKSLQCKQASLARWRRGSPYRAAPLSVPTLGPRPAHGTARAEWEAKRAQLVSLQACRSAIAQRHDEELGRPWTMETSIGVIEAVLNLMPASSLPLSPLCPPVSLLSSSPMLPLSLQCPTSAPTLRSASPPVCMPSHT